MVGRLLIALALWASLGSAASAASGEIVELGGINVAVWAPEGRAGEKFPVVLFSHGVLSCATQSRFLTRAIADAGYLVFSPSHRDSACDRARMQFPYNALRAWD